MPVDVWNVHNFVLREERGSWGVDIPPGIPDDRVCSNEVRTAATWTCSNSRWSPSGAGWRNAVSAIRR